jgi:hypothetical protein
VTVDPGSRGWNEHRHRWDVPAGTIRTADLADGSVTTAKLVDGSVTTPKLASGVVVNKVLDVAEATDILSATAIAANTEIQIGTRWTLTKADAASLLLVTVQAVVLIVPTAGSGEISLGLWLNDGATKFRIAGGAASATGSWVATSGGSLVISGAAAGLRAVQLALFAAPAGSLYCRCATLPSQEFAKMQVLELRAP